MLPWIHVFADESGVMWPCCRAVGSRRPNCDDAGRPRNAFDPEGLQAGMNTEVMRRLRLDMLEGRRPAACERCYRVEDLGITSYRQIENEDRRELIDDLVARTTRDGAIEAKLLSADLRLGNVCNLRCRMCSPQSSRALLPEWASFHGVPLANRYFDRFRGIDWFEDPDFWRLIEQGAPELQRINFAGGEPLLIGGMFDFLERLVASGRASAMTISYNTNLTVLPERVRALWPKFAAVRVIASIDGIGAVNEFIRHPSRWEDVRANLRTLDREVAALNLSGGLATNTAMQVCNVFGLGDLLDFLAGELEHFEAPNLTIVTQPEHLDVRILTPDIKAALTQRLSDVVERGSSRWHARWGAKGAHTVEAAIAGLLTHMNQCDATQHLAKFRRWSDHFDRTRQQSTAAVIPELAPLFAD